jgi:glycosyltransferase 2 family protein
VSTLRRAVPLLVSALVLAALYRTVNLQQVSEALLRVRPLWAVVSIAMIGPITVCRAVRFYWVAPAGAMPGIGEAFRLTLAASALNVFLPAKTGDLVKSYFVATRGHVSAGHGVAIVVYERLCDLLALVGCSLIAFAIARPIVPGVGRVLWILLAAIAAVCALLITSSRAALIVGRLAAAAFPGRRLTRLRALLGGWPELHEQLRGRRRWVISFSFVMWLGHLLQIWMFTIALSLRVPFTISASLTALALMAGQIPLAVAGIGPRDVALVVLLSNYVTAESAAALGVLVSSRTILPPLMGLPVIRPYLASVVADARRWAKGYRTDTAMRA